jgi:hypothetical protein
MNKEQIMSKLKANSQSLREFMERYLFGSVVRQAKADERCRSALNSGMTHISNCSRFTASAHIVHNA